MAIANFVFYCVICAVSISFLWQIFKNKMKIMLFLMYDVSFVLLKNLSLVVRVYLTVSGEILFLGKKKSF